MKPYLSVDTLINHIQRTVFAIFLFTGGIWLFLGCEGIVVPSLNSASDPLPEPGTPISGALSYKPIVTSLRESISQIPEWSKHLRGQKVQYSVSPALPSGLSIDADLGIITGKPGKSQESTTYTITVNGVAPYAGTI